MFEHFRAYLARPTFFLAGGIAIGALLAPSFGGGGAQAVTTYTRALSCPGLAFQPLTSSQDSINYVSLREGGGYFVCGVDVPNKAVVTRVRFTLFDSGAADVRNCALVRVPLTTDLADNFEVMVAVPTTSTIGKERLSDTTISAATIDNMNFSYFLQCQITVSNNILTAQGIYGADITFKITAANG